MVIDLSEQRFHRERRRSLMNVMRTTKLSFDRRALATQAMQAAVATRAKAKLDQVGPICIYALCETLGVACASTTSTWKRCISAVFHRASISPRDGRCRGAPTIARTSSAITCSATARRSTSCARTQGTALGGPEGIPGRHLRELHPHADHRPAPRLLGPGLDSGRRDANANLHHRLRVRSRLATACARRVH